MKNYTGISNRYFKENKKRTTLTIMGIFLATTLIFAIGTFLLSIRDSIIDDIRENGNYEFVISDITADKVEKLENNVEVKDISINEKKPLEYIEEELNIMFHLSNYNKEAYKNIVDEECIEGSFPKEANEVVVDIYSSEKYNIKVGDKLNLVDSELNEKEYIVSGLYEKNYYNTVDYIEVLGLIEDTLQDDTVYDVYLNVKSDKDKQNVIRKVLDNSGIDILSKSDNSQLLYLTGNGGDEYITEGITYILIFVLATVIISTITVIYNSFNISVIERIKYFGILKAIGATNKQIKRIVYKEAYLMGLLALPLGCIVGYFALKYGVKLFLGNEVLMISFKIKFYPIVIIISALIVTLTIYLSLLGPTRKVKKITAVEAMKNSNEIKVSKIKKRKTRLIGKLFGVEGSIAYKNIRRTPLRFIITLIALIVSIVLFNVFYSFMDFTKQIVNQQMIGIPFDSQLVKSDNSNLSNLSNEELNEVLSQPFSKDVYQYYQSEKFGKIPSEHINNENTSLLSNSNGYTDILIHYCAGIGEKELDFAKKYIKDGDIDYEKLKSNGVVLVDGKLIKNEKGQKETVRVTDYKVGDKIQIYNEDTQAYFEGTVVEIISRDMLTGFNFNEEIGIVTLFDVYKSFAQDAEINNVSFIFDNKQDRQDAIDYFDKNSNSNGYYYQDIGEQIDEINKIYSQMEFFVYCFIIVITIISILNIFNTISTNILLRKRELSTLRAIGMTEGQLNKSIILEGTLYGIIAAIIGGIMSIVLSKLMILAGSTLGDVEYNFSELAFLISIICAIMVTYVSTLIPLRRIKKLTIVEGISEEE